MEILEIVKLSIIAFSILLSIVMMILYLASKHARKKETREKATSALNTAQSIFDLLNLVQNAVIQSDTNLNFTSAEKFNQTFISVKNELFKQNKNVDDTTLTNMIENEIVVSQHVNASDEQRAKTTELKKIEITEE